MFVKPATLAIFAALPLACVEYSVRVGELPKPFLYAQTVCL